MLPADQDVLDRRSRELGFTFTTKHLAIEQRVEALEAKRPEGTWERLRRLHAELLSYETELDGVDEPPDPGPVARPALRVIHGGATG